MLATKASAKSNKPSTMRDDRIMRTREEQTNNLDLRELGRGDRQNLAALQATAKTDAYVNAQCCTKERCRQTDVENDKAPHSNQALALRPTDLAPEVAPREVPMCRSSGVAEHKSTDYRLILQSSHSKVCNSGNRHPRQSCLNFCMKHSSMTLGHCRCWWRWRRREGRARQASPRRTSMSLFCV